MTPLDDGAALGWSRGLVAAALLAGATAFGGGALAGEALVRARGGGAADAAPPGPSQAPDPETPPRAETLALLSPLAPGKDVGGCTVSEIAERSGVIRVRCRTGSVEQQLAVALADGSAAHPPATAGPFVVYYASSGGDQAGLQTARALAAVLAAHAPLVAPAWLGPLRGAP